MTRRQLPRMKDSELSTLGIAYSLARNIKLLEERLPDSQFERRHEALAKAILKKYDIPSPFGSKS